MEVRVGLRALLLGVGLAVGLLACAPWRPLQPAPPLYALWAKPGVDEQGVRSALLGCGFVDAAQVDASQMPLNDYAAAELCMLGRGFHYQDRRIVCTDSPQLPACAGVPRGRTFGSDADFDPAQVSQRPAAVPAYSRWQRAGADSAAVQRAMLACGYRSVTQPAEVMRENDHAAAQLCMLDQHFSYAYPANALLCRSRPQLPACHGRMIDAQHCCEAPRPAGAR